MRTSKYAFLLLLGAIIYGAAAEVDSEDDKEDPRFSFNMNGGSHLNYHGVKDVWNGIVSGGNLLSGNYELTGNVDNKTGLGISGEASFAVPIISGNKTFGLSINHNNEKEAAKPDEKPKSRDVRSIGGKRGEIDLIRSSIMKLTR